MQARSPLSKRLRFKIFARDGFKCRYCGKTSADAILVVDHIHPVCEGGTDDPENLATACEPCNQGKSGFTLDAAATPAPTPNPLLLAQELQEQKAAFDLIRKQRAMTDGAKQDLCNYWCEALNCPDITERNLNTLVSFVEKHGIRLVCRWIDILAASRKCPGDEDRQMQYLCGIRRHEIQEA
jgi:hypothetical protein